MRDELRLFQYRQFSVVSTEGGIGHATTRHFQSAESLDARFVDRLPALFLPSRGRVRHGPVRVSVFPHGVTLLLGPFHRPCLAMVCQRGIRGRNGVVEKKREWRSGCMWRHWSIPRPELLGYVSACCQELRGGLLCLDIEHGAAFPGKPWLDRPCGGGSKADGYGF
jgi:hypothetical protein